MAHPPRPPHDFAPFAAVSAPAVSPHTSGRWVRYAWLIPVLVAVTVYAVGLDNFFTWDDFIWLDRARTFARTWPRMFLPDVCYFDPLVHLMFAADFAVAGVQSRWYQGGDLALHAGNAVLMYRLARELGHGERAALYAGVLFAGSCAAADAVLWASSRVDLVATTFGIWSLLWFVRYLRSDKQRDLVWSLLLFVLALGAKGTLLVLPGVMLWLLLLERKPFRQAAALLPFVAVTALYLVLLKLSLPHAAMPSATTTINLDNLLLAFGGLFVPDRYLVVLNPYVVAAALIVPVTATGLCALRSGATLELRRVGWFLLLAALVPVVAADDFRPVTDGGNFYRLLSSPSHRIYFATAGMSLLGGGLLHVVEEWLGARAPKAGTVVAVVLLALITAGNFVVVRDRSAMWKFMGDSYRDEVSGLYRYRGQVGAGSLVGLVHFTGSPGFLTPMMKICFGIDDLTQLNPIAIDMSYNEELLAKAGQSFLFVRSPDGIVLDKTTQFRQMLELNRMVLQHPDSPRCRDEFRVVASSLLWEVRQIIGAESSPTQ